jgi:type I restriction enzyme R subunit
MILVHLIVKKGEEAVKELPEPGEAEPGGYGGAIENNVRRLIIDEMPTNPKYYQRMSELLSELVKRRKHEDIAYKEYLAQIVALTKQVRNPEQSAYYPDALDTKGKQALYDNLGKDEGKAIALHQAVTHAREDGWRGHPQKERRIRIEIRRSLPELSDDELKDLFEIVKNQHEY